MLGDVLDVFGRAAAAATHNIHKPTFGKIFHKMAHFVRRLVIFPKFSLVGSFSQGLAAARQDDGWGFIDQRGNWVVAPQFVSLTSMNEQGFAFGVSTSGDLVRVSRDGSQRMLVPDKLKAGEVQILLQRQATVADALDSAARRSAQECGGLFPLV